MNILQGVGEFFALDVGSNSIRVVQLTGSARSGWGLVAWGYAQVPVEIIQSAAPEAKKRLGEAIATVVLQSGIKLKNVAIGIPSNKGWTTVIEVQNQPIKELEKVVKYQLDQYVPMSVDDAQVDFAFLGPSPVDATKMEVLIASTAKKYIEERMEFIEGLGFNLVGVEPEAIAMARSLAPFGTTDARIAVDFGETSVDIVTTMSGAPLLVRSIPGGLQYLYQTAATSLGVGEMEARQYILKFGLQQDALDGKLFKVLGTALENLTGELVRSIKYFQQKFNDMAIGGVALSGYAGGMPFLSEYVEAKIGVPTSVGNPWQRVNVPKTMQDKLMPVANEFAVAIGLAERSGRVTHG